MPPSRHSSSSHSSHRSSHRSSSHSRSSHSSRSTRFTHGTGAAMRRAIYRPTRNQPKGYYSSGSNMGRSSRVHCKLHDYTYYPQDWEYEGVRYKSGYYDENGTYYDRVVFRQNKSFKSEFKCEYCGNLAQMTWQEGQMPTCKCCGASMIMTGTPVDEIIEEEYGYLEPSRDSRIVSAIIWTIFILVFGMIMVSFLGSFFMTVKRTNDAYSYFDEYYEDYEDYDNSDGNRDVYGDTLYLNEVREGVYEVSDSSNYDKYLTWDYGSDSYYDVDSDCYVWYNTDVSPNLWQYWYEDISSIYGDYGWMECEGDAWYIEVDDNDWQPIDLTPKEKEKIWHIENKFD